MSAENTAAARTAALLASLWQKNRPLMLDRLDLLDRAAAGSLTPELRAEAISVAHKLAGTLGMFGYPEGTALAREMEETLEAGDDGQNLHDLTTRLRMLLFPEG